MRRLLCTLSALALVLLALPAVAAEVPPLQPEPAVTVDLAALSDSAQQCLVPTASKTTDSPELDLGSEGYSCLVCWRDRDCNTYCGGPWGDCYQGCCACTQ